MTPRPKVFVIDDDPTGTQAVHGVPVLTAWDADALAAEMDDPAPACFLLANSRALPEARAASLARATGEALRAAGARTGKPFVAVSRSDSTLRGHFPAEVEALAEGLGIPDATIVLCPFFAAGGRVTEGDVHYVLDGDRRVPAGETEFARDASFGYRSSNLRDWVVEKSGGAIARDRTASIDLETVRRGPDAVAARLAELSPDCRVVVVNALTRDDVAAFAAGLEIAEAAGRRFVCRSAADLAAARAGIAPRPPLDPASLALPPGPVLTVVGSYVQKTTDQLALLRALPGLASVELSVDAVLDDAPGAEAARAARAVADALAAGRDTVLFTSRERRRAGDLETGARISRALVEAVRALPDAVRPRALVAKGGITSSDVATDALGIRRAWVEGQIAPGVPLWRTGSESRWPGMATVVFPGNVGAPDTLARVVERLRLPPRS